MYYDIHIKCIFIKDYPKYEETLIVMVILVDVLFGNCFIFLLLKRRVSVIKVQRLNNSI